MTQRQEHEKHEGVIYRLGAKAYLVDPEGIDFGGFIEVFNRWIQDQPIAGHLLIDVHDYRHVQHGPGVLLVGHQGSFSLDFGEGRPGLVYYRKQPLGITTKLLDEACRTYFLDKPLHWTEAVV